MFTIAELSDVTGERVETTRRWVKKSGVEVIKRGRYYLVTRRAVWALFKQGAPDVLAELDDNAA
ncbi:MAG TPA: hypothetical protein VHM19_08940 [Polyangiales bacterium]|nr:hypothetical protein [Polyangiales bacterium]